jgi:putative PIN family toxin of toxin-antitoxin system
VRSKPRYGFDTNVVVSALLFSRSKPARAFFAALDEGEVLVSADVIKELNDVLGREKFERYVSEEERTRFLRSLLREASLIEPEEEIQACRDPKDDKYLELAVSGGADYIVSGDDDMLALNPFRGIPILTPDEFLSRVSRQTPGQEA